MCTCKHLLVTQVEYAGVRSPVSCTSGVCKHPLVVQVGLYVRACQTLAQSASEQAAAR